MPQDGDASAAQRRVLEADARSPLPVGGRVPTGKPHRCNDRIEDAIQGLFKDNWGANFWPLARTAYECLQSEPGREPNVPYKFVTPEDAPAPPR